MPVHLIYYSCLDEGLQWPQHVGNFLRILLQISLFIKAFLFFLRRMPWSAYLFRNQVFCLPKSTFALTDSLQNYAVALQPVYLTTSVHLFRFLLFRLYFYFIDVSNFLFDAASRGARTHFTVVYLYMT